MLGSHALRGPLARGKELDSEPCTGTAAATAAEHSWCLGTCMHCPSLGGDKHRVGVWRGRTSTSNTSRRGQERSGGPTVPRPLSLGAGDNPKARTRAPLPSCQALYRDGVECLASLLLPPAPLCPLRDIPPTLRPWPATSPLPPLAPHPCKLSGHQPSTALDSRRHLWRVRAGNKALLPAAGREMGAQSHPAHLGEVKESKLTKPALNQLAWFCSAAGETPTIRKREHE